MEKKKRVGVSTELYEIYLKETSKEARRTHLEMMYWEEEEIEEELKKRISFNDFVMDYINGFYNLYASYQRLSEDLDAEMASNHHPACTCSTCEECRRESAKEEAERRAEESMEDFFEEWD